MDESSYPRTGSLPSRNRRCSFVRFNKVRRTATRDAYPVQPSSGLDRTTKVLHTYFLFSKRREKKEGKTRRVFFSVIRMQARRGDIYNEIYIETTPTVFKLTPSYGVVVVVCGLLFGCFLGGGGFDLGRTFWECSFAGGRWAFFLFYVSLFLCVVVIFIFIFLFLFSSSQQGASHGPPRRMHKHPTTNTPPYFTSSTHQYAPSSYTPFSLIARLQYSFRVGISSIFSLSQFVSYPFPPSDIFFSLLSLPPFIREIRTHFYFINFFSLIPSSLRFSVFSAPLFLTVLFVSSVVVSPAPVCFSWREGGAFCWVSFGMGKDQDRITEVEQPRSTIKEKTAKKRRENHKSYMNKIYECKHSISFQKQARKRENYKSNKKGVKKWEVAEYSIITNLSTKGTNWPILFSLHLDEEVLFLVRNSAGLGNTIIYMHSSTRLQYFTPSFLSL
eukprot:gene11711-8058_t